MTKGEHSQNEVERKLDEWISLLSDQDNGCLEDLQEHFKIEEKDKEVTYEKHDDEHGMDNVLDIIYHDIDMDDAEVDESMRSGTVTFANKDTFRGFFSSDIQRRTGTCHKNIPYNNLGTTGTWNNGVLEGMAWIENAYGGYTETFFKRGVRHGYSRSFGPQPKKKGNLWQVALYKNGNMDGHFWRGCLGGGYITGVKLQETILHTYSPISKMLF